MRRGPQAETRRAWSSLAAAVTLAGLAVVGLLAYYSPGPRDDRPLPMKPAVGAGAVPSAVAARGDLPIPTRGVKLLDPKREPYEADDLYPESDDLRALRGWCAQHGVVRADCAFAYFSDYTKTHGVPAAQAEIERLKPLDRNFLQLCHTAYHGVGQNAPALIGQEAAFALATDSCQAGYIHGIVQIWTIQGNRAAILAGSTTICETLHNSGLAKADTYTRFCGHGLGHAIAIHVAESIYAAVDACTKVPFVADACVEGVIMEYSGEGDITFAIKDKLGSNPTASLTAQQRKDVCTHLSGVVGRRCWAKVFQLWTDVWESAPDYVSRCAPSKKIEGDWQECIKAWGEIRANRARPIAVDSPADQLNALIARCNDMPATGHLSCMKGALEVLWRDEPLGSTPVTSICPVLRSDLRRDCAAAEEFALKFRASA